MACAQCKAEYNKGVRDGAMETLRELRPIIQKSAYWEGYNKASEEIKHDLEGFNYNEAFYEGFEAGELNALDELEEYKEAKDKVEWFENRIKEKRAKKDGY